MATYLMFGKYSPEAMRLVSADRTEEALAVIRQYGGELKSAYALLCETDFVAILEFPDNERALQTAVTLTRLLGISYRIAPAISLERFDQLMA